MEPAAESPARTLPEVSATTAHFWTSGSRGVLELLQCTDCDYWIHPPSPVCPQCLGKPEPRAVSGRGHVHSFTVNHHPWEPGVAVPYVVAVVELDEQDGLRLTTNIVDCPCDEVTFEMPVQVRFEHCDDVYLPLFGPLSDG